MPISHLTPNHGSILWTWGSNTHPPQDRSMIENDITHWTSNISNSSWNEEIEYWPHLLLDLEAIYEKLANNTSVTASPSILYDDCLLFSPVEPGLREPLCDSASELFVLSRFSFWRVLCLGVRPAASKSCFMSLVFVPFSVIEVFPFGDSEATLPLRFFLFLGITFSVQSSSSLESEETFPYASLTNQRIRKKSETGRKGYKLASKNIKNYNENKKAQQRGTIREVILFFQVGCSGCCWFLWINVHHIFISLV